MKTYILILSILTLSFAACKKNETRIQHEEITKTKQVENASANNKKPKVQWWNVRDYGNFKTAYMYYRPGQGC